ncbi:hypothetical protein SAY87_030478 [Trapa incisa]|uniref:Bet v I/Major latex protein domain-containing protein n=1 Tax=Trapa incisa TaxID=236973 RepID=A0AAN7KMH4_9MYRT|nr:hypothetical protein SAY87_030476 [Trapa incisa]KAK4769945.1 hypothetical protein SAY87_030477 [Trapa incisa]KAK4769946.1 hypothetical protein SAY87_030478 [Trapa incisa]
MGIVVKDMEITSTVSPARMFQAFVLESDHIFPKVHPHAFKCIELVEGDGGVGSIKKITFAEEHIKHAKHRIDLLDKEKFVYHYTWIEGDALMKVFEKISYEIKFEAHHHGSVCKVTTKFFVIGDVNLDEEKLEAGKEKFIGLFRAVEAHVLAN